MIVTTTRITNPYGVVADVGTFMLAQDGYWVIPNTEANSYVLSLNLRCASAGSITVGAETKAITAGWQRVKFYFENSGTDIAIKFTAGTYFIYEAQLETGTKGTDWNPAPEDAEGSIEAITKNIYVPGTTLINGEVVALGTLIVGKNVLMGENATIKWDRVEGKPDLMDEEHFRTEIGPDWLRTSELEAENLTIKGGSVQVDTSSEKFNVLRLNYESEQHQRQTSITPSSTTIADERKAVRIHPSRIDLCRTEELVLKDPSLSSFEMDGTIGVTDDGDSYFMAENDLDLHASDNASIRGRDVSISAVHGDVELSTDSSKVVMREDGDIDIYAEGGEVAIVGESGVKIRADADESNVEIKSGNDGAVRIEGSTNVNVKCAGDTLELEGGTGVAFTAPDMTFNDVPMSFYDDAELSLYPGDSTSMEIPNDAQTLIFEGYVDSTTPHSLLTVPACAIPNHDSVFSYFSMMGMKRNGTAAMLKIGLRKSVTDKKLYITVEGINADSSAELRYLYYRV